MQQLEPDPLDSTPRESAERSHASKHSSSFEESLLYSHAIEGHHEHGLRGMRLVQYLREARCREGFSEEQVSDHHLFTLAGETIEENPVIIALREKSIPQIGRASCRERV